MAVLMLEQQKMRNYDKDQMAEILTIGPLYKKVLNQEIYLF